jgi:hypothetical protein
MVDLGNSSTVKVNNAECVKAMLIDGDILEMGEKQFKIKLL